MQDLQQIVDFLDEAKVYYLATVDGDRPRVRPFGTALLYNGRLYIQTGKVKAVSRQLAENPNAEICAFMDGKWLRISGELIDDPDIAPAAAMLEKMPMLKGMYAPGDGNMQVLYFKNARAEFNEFGKQPEVFEF